MEKCLRFGRAVDLRGLIDHGVDVLDPSVVDQHAPAEAVPDQNQQHRPDGAPMTKGVERALIAEKDENLLKKAEIRVIDEFPQIGDDRHGDHVRNEVDAPQKALGLSLQTVKLQRHIDRDGVLDGDKADGQQQRIQ